MGICPLCNGFKSSLTNCPTCNQLLKDKGRVIDYFDDYSPYMEIEVMKRIDSYEQTWEGNLCAHLLYCDQCEAEHVVHIQE